MSLIGLIIVIFLVFILLGAFGGAYRGDLGYAPGGIIGLILVVVLILVLLGHL